MNFKQIRLGIAIFLGLGLFPYQALCQQVSIKNIQISGISHAQARRMVQDFSFVTPLNQKISETDILKDADRLYLLGIFHDVRYELVPAQEGYELNFQVKENPEIQMIHFDGNSIF